MNLILDSITMGIIYKISGPENIPCKSMDYVSQTSKSMIKRWADHKSHYNKYISNSKDKYLYEIMQEYKFSNYKITELEVCDSNLLDEREIYWAEKLSLENPDKFDPEYNSKNATHRPR